ncbi:MAG: hypothetical protein WCH05_10500, partial [Chlorobiaceae bacterium]
RSLVRYRVEWLFPVMSIEDVLLRQGLFYERRKNFYINLNHTPTEIVTPLYIASGYIALVLKLPHRAVALRSKFMRSPEAYNTVFSTKVNLDVWPKIASILKRVDIELEKLRPSSKRTDRFLKGWRYIVALLLVSKATEKFSFSSAELVSYDLSKITSEAVKQIWNELNQYSTSKPSEGWTERTKVIDVLRQFGIRNGISGIEMLERRPENLFGSSGGQFYREMPPAITEDFILQVKAALPPQPWKPGMHRIITSQLKCSRVAFSAAIDRLIEDGLLYQQRDGVLYDLDGNVVAFDPDRVDGSSLGEGLPRKLD